MRVSRACIYSRVCGRMDAWVPWHLPVVTAPSIVSCHVVSCNVVSCHVMSCCAVPCRVVLCRVVSCRVVSSWATRLVPMVFIPTHGRSISRRPCHRLARQQQPKLVTSLVCTHACVRACVHACVRACVRPCLRVCVRLCESLRAAVSVCTCMRQHCTTWVGVTAYVGGNSRVYFAIE